MYLILNYTMLVYYCISHDNIQVIHSTTGMIEALVIGNTTAHNIDAHNKLAMIITVCACLFCRLFSIMPEPGGKILRLRWLPQGLSHGSIHRFRYANRVKVVFRIWPDSVCS